VNSAVFLVRGYSYDKADYSGRAFLPLEQNSVAKQYPAIQVWSSGSMFAG
jgi:hypothetical protein